MKFDDYDAGTGAAIKKLERENFITWVVALVVGAVGLHFTPSISEGEQLVFAAVLAVGAAVMQEVRKVRLDALRRERFKLSEAFNSMRYETERDKGDKANQRED